MIIKANGKTITVNNIYSETIRQNGKGYPALRFVFSGGVTSTELKALSSGALEIVDDTGAVIGSHTGYTTPGELSFIVGKVTTAEQERDELAAALAVEEAKKPLIAKLTETLPDVTASTVVGLFPTLTGGGGLIAAGTRINWRGALMRAAVDLWDREDCDPDHSPDSWEAIQYRDGYRIIPAVITAGLAFGEGELGWWGDILYRSTKPDNVHTPEQYAAGWEIVE